MQDTYRHKGLRKQLISSIRRKGIKDEVVLAAMDVVPRHLFMDSSFVSFAYKDQAFPIGAGQTISQPYTVAFQTELLEVKRGDKVLEIGTGSGYQAAILVQMGAKVYTIERQRELFLKAQKLLSDLGYQASFFFGDGMEGKPSYGPYDKILITAATNEVPGKLLEQLVTGGIMVVPVGNSFSQAMIRIIRTGPGEYSRSTHGSFVFVPLLPGTEG